MEISNKLIKDIAALAKLEFSQKSAEEMKKDLGQIISFVDKLSEVETDDIKPLIYLSEEVSVLREDEIQMMITQEEALRNAPEKDSDYFKVPTILKK